MLYHSSGITSLGKESHILPHKCIRKSLDSVSPWYWRPILYQTDVEYLFKRSLTLCTSSPGGASDKEPACQCRRCKRCWFDQSGRSPRGGHGNPLQYSCLKNPMDRGVWQTTVNRVTQSLIRLKQFSSHAHNLIHSTLRKKKAYKCEKN